MHGDSSGTQKKGNVRRWKPLPKGAGEDAVDREYIVRVIVNWRLCKFENCCKFEVFTLVTKNNAVFWNIKPSLYLTGDALQLSYRAKPVNAM
jgi:hypothetical protein